MELATIIGFVASAASTISFVPQTWKLIHSRHAADLSTGTYSVTVIGFGLWTIYGILLRQWPLIFTNSVCLLLSGFILFMKMLSRRQRNAVADILDPKA